ncbi:hypothetical protein [Streptomyces californicus]|uniref:hypothetical protein n=1 Tax=Streptomyces californicus TaxID=67351 RepID=UPI0033D2ED02
MTALYALAGSISGELLTHGGKVLVHGDRAELEALVVGARAIPFPPSIPIEDTKRLRDHPGLAHLRWPLRKEDLR